MYCFRSLSEGSQFNFIVTSLSFKDNYTHSYKVKEQWPQKYSLFICKNFGSNQQSLSQLFQTLLESRYNFTGTYDLSAILDFQGCVC